MEESKIFSKKEVDKWDLRFLNLAHYISTWSKDPSTQVGSVIVDENNRIISVGFNGFPRGVKDLPERLNDRETKYQLVVHGEINAILFANRSLEGCKIYTYPFMPCMRCAGPVIQSGIKKVIAPTTENPRWKEDFEKSKAQLEEANVEVCLLENFVPDFKVDKV